MVQLQSLSPSNHPKNSNENHFQNFQNSAAISPHKVPSRSNSPTLAHHALQQNHQLSKEEEFLFQDSADEASADIRPASVDIRPASSSPLAKSNNPSHDDFEKGVEEHVQSEAILERNLNIEIEKNVESPVHHPVTSGKKLPLIMPPPQRKPRRKSSRPSTTPTFANTDGSNDAGAPAFATVPSAHSAVSGTVPFDLEEIDMEDNELHYNLLQKLGLSFDEDQDDEQEGTPVKPVQEVQPAPFPYPAQSESDFSREKKICLAILSLLFQHDSSYSFQFPVDPTALGLPDYHQVITRPMDLTTVKSKIENMEFIPPSSDSGIAPFMERSPLDVLIDGTGQTLQNCYKYNPKGNPIRKDAWFLIAYFDSLLQSHLTRRKVNWRRYWGFDDFRSYEKIINDKRRGPNRKSGRPSKAKIAAVTSTSKSMTRNTSHSSLLSDPHNAESEHQASLSSLYGGDYSHMNTSHTPGPYGHKKRRLNANAILHSYPSASSSLLYSILGRSHK